MGEKYEEDSVNVSLNADCKDFLNQNFEKILKEYLANFNKKKEMEEMKTKMQEEIDNLKIKLEEKKEESQIVVNELKAMVAK